MHNMYTLCQILYVASVCTCIYVSTCECMRSTIIRDFSWNFLGGGGGGGELTEKHPLDLTNI